MVSEGLETDPCDPHVVSLQVMQAAISSATRIGLIQIPVTEECDCPVEFPTAPAVAFA